MALLKFYKTLANIPPFLSPLLLPRFIHGITLAEAIKIPVSLLPPSLLSILRQKVTVKQQWKREEGRRGTGLMNITGEIHQNSFKNSKKIFTLMSQAIL